MKPPTLQEPRLSHETIMHYTPASSTVATGMGVGPAWTTDANATVSHPSPAAGFTTQFRRTRYTSTANSNIHLGPFFASADHCCVYRGNAVNRGGFYFRAQVMINAIPNDDIRFFCGVSAQTGTGVCVANTAPANSMGFFCDTGDNGALHLVVVDGTPTQTKTVLNPAVTLTAGVMYEFIIICNPNQAVIVTQVNNLGNTTGGAQGTVLNSQNVSVNAITNTVMMAPQVGLGNAANNSGGDCSLDVVSVYLRPNLKLLHTGTP